MSPENRWIFRAPLFIGKTGEKDYFPITDRLRARKAESLCRNPARAVSLLSIRSCSERT